MFIQHFGAPYSKVSLVGSIILGIGYGLGPISSFLVSKFGSRVVCMGGGLMTMAGVGFSVLSPNLSVMFVLYGVMSGAGIGLMFLPTGISCNYYFKKKRAIANGNAPGQGSFFGLSALSRFLRFFSPKQDW